MKCADTGDKTLKKTARNMELLSQLTHELSEPDGIVHPPLYTYTALLRCLSQNTNYLEPRQIDKMLEFSEPGQSKDRDDYLEDIIELGEENIAECMSAIEEVSASFDGWCDFTKTLHLALRDTLGKAFLYFQFKRSFAKSINIQAAHAERSGTSRARSSSTRWTKN